MAIDDVFEALVREHPAVKMIGCFWFASLLFDGLVSEVHPFCNGGGIGVDWDGFLVETVNPEVELCKVNEAAWTNRQRNVIDKGLVVSDLDEIVSK